MLWVCLVCLLWVEAIDQSILLEDKVGCPLHFLPVRIDQPEMGELPRNSLVGRHLLTIDLHLLFCDGTFVGSHSVPLYKEFCFRTLDFQ